jgi:hypothetical protein
MYMFMCARMYLQWGEANNKSSPISPEMEWHKPPCHFLHFSHHVVRHKTTLYFTQTVMLMLCDPKKETVTPLVKAEGTNSSLSLIHFYEYFHHCIYNYIYRILYNQYQGRQDPCHFPTRALWNSAIDNFFRPAAGEPDLANGRWGASCHIMAIRWHML